MSEVKDVRAALDRLRNRRESNTGLESAIVSEGLAACDEAEIPRGAESWIRVNVYASILRKAGLM